MLLLLLNTIWQVMAAIMLGHNDVLVTEKIPRAQQKCSSEGNKNQDYPPT